MAYLKNSKANKKLVNRHKKLVNRHKKLVFIADRIKPVNNDFYL